MTKFVVVLCFVAGLTCCTMIAGAQEMTLLEEETDIVGGKVTAVDAANNILTVADESGTTYAVIATKEETSIWKGDDTIDLPDIKLDDAVELEYYKEDDGSLVAIWVDILLQEDLVTPEAPSEPAAPEVAATPVE